MEIHSRLPDVGTSIFTVMSRMALEEGAINLSQGFPDFQIDDEIIDLVYKYMRQGNNQYAPMPGTVELRTAIASVIKATFNRSVDPESEVTITAGATESTYSVIAAFISPGDEVIIFDPAYDAYNPVVRLHGGTPVHINLNPPDFGIPWDLVTSRITPRTKMIIINTPHNPSGAVLRPSDLAKLQEIVLKHDLLVLSDEVYERLIFDGKRHESVLHYPALADRSFAVFSFGKTFHATGWKVGYVTAPAPLMREVRKTHQFVTFAVNTPVQLALAEYLKTPEHYLSLGQFYQRKRDFFLDHIKGSSFEPLPCHGSYFQVLGFRQVANKSEVEMCEELTRKFKVACIALSVFYQDGTDNRLLRFCFAKKEETLEKACAILRKL